MSAAIASVPVYVNQSSQTEFHGIEKSSQTERHSVDQFSQTERQSIDQSSQTKSQGVEMSVQTEPVNFVPFIQPAPPTSPTTFVPPLAPGSVRAAIAVDEDLNLCRALGFTEDAAAYHSRNSRDAQRRFVTKWSKLFIRDKIASLLPTNRPATPTESQEAREQAQKEADALREKHNRIKDQRMRAADLGEAERLRREAKARKEVEEDSSGVKGEAGSQE
jgi:hypothetical protein